MRRLGNLWALLAACAAVWAGPPAHLMLVKSHSGSFTQGQTGVWTITVSNNGPGATAGPLTLTDALPTGYTLASASGTGWNSCTGTGTGNVSCTSADALKDGDARTLTLTVNVPANSPTSVQNQASAGDGTNSASSNIDVVSVAQAPANVSAAGGTPQSATVGTAFATSLSARVTDSSGTGVPGVTVTFNAPASGPSGTFNGGINTAVTNAAGIASIGFTANTMVGSYLVSASAGTVTGATFALTNTAGAPAHISATAGTPQSTAINTAFSSPLSALVTDTFGNPVAGASVTFAAPASGASGVFAGGANTATTNGFGVATSGVFTANGIAGSYQVTASAGAATGAIFSLTNSVGSAATIAVVSGSPQSAQINTAFALPLVAIVKDAGGNPVSGASVTFSAPASGPSGSFGGAATVVTGADGQAVSPAFTANGSVGSYSVTATTGALSTTFSLTNTAGAAASIAALSGGGQTAAINSPFANPLVVLVKDSGGNPLSGVSVTFTAPASGASASFGGSASSTVTTGANGQATSPALTANGTVGGYSVSATAGALSTTFSLTNTAGSAASISPVSGGGQSAHINTGFPSPLVVIAKDSGGNPVSGVSVTFSAPLSGASATFGGSAIVVTGVDGQATSPALTANGITGSYSVTATAGALSTSFTLTNTAGSAAVITAVSGSGQNAKINTSFAAPLVAVVKDSGGNPVAGVSVTFAAPGSGASATFGGPTTVTTGADGQATSPLPTANGTVGAYSVTATATNIATPASFALTNTAGSAATINVVSGSGQSAKVNTAFSSPLVAVVKDSGGNPVAGVSVTFAAPATGASATFGGATTVITGADGQATSPALTANAVTGGYSVTATATGVGTAAAFSLTNVAGTPGSVSVVSGSGQSAQTNTAFSSPLVAIVKDSGGNPVAGVSVTFAAPASGASATFGGPATVTTGSDGTATSPTLTANGTAGAYSVNATTNGVSSPASFSLTNTAGSPGSISAVSGSGQTAPINAAFTSPLVVIVKDSGGNPVSGISVTFTAPSSGASATFGGPATVTTGANGQATSPALTANATAGAYTITASASGVSSTATFSLTNSAGAAASITPASGGGQSAQINTAFSSPLVAIVKDAGGNPVSGVTVTFAAPASGASATFGASTTVTTGANGQATSPLPTANGTAGTYNISASVAGIASPATFALTNTAGAPGGITAVSGGGQTAQINTAFANTLIAVVKDSGGNPVAGVSVTFTAPATGASATFGASSTVSTNANGQAVSPTLTANGNAGTYTVTASAAGVGSTATFSLTNTAGAPGGIAVVSGSGQSAQINTNFASPFVAVVKDSGGNPVSGVTVTFTAPASGAGGSFGGNATATATTGTNGQATSPTFQANGSVGSYTVMASAPGVSTPATFSLTNTGPILSITKTHSGSFTQGQQNATYSITVSNAANAGPTIGGVTVTETVPSGLTLVSMSGSGWNCTNNTCTRTDALNGGASYPAITVAVNVAATATSPAVNAAAVSGGGSAPANTTDSTVIAPHPALLSITKTHSGSVTQGQKNFTYAITVSNGANAGPTSGIVTVSETLPTGLSLVSLSGSGWSCSGGSCTRNDTLNAGSTYASLTAVVNVAADAPAQVTNTVGVSGGGSAAASASDPTTVTPLVVSTTSLANGSTSAGYSQTLTATGGTAPYNWSVASGALPGGLSLATGGQITGTPTATGNFTFTAKVTDTNGVTAQGNLAITVIAGVVISGCPAASATVGQAYDATLQASGGTSPYTWSISAGQLPAGLNLDTQGGKIAGTPGAATSGPVTFTLKVIDKAGGSNTQDCQIKVNDVLSIGTSALSDAMIGVPYTRALTASGGQPPYNWSVSGGGTLPVPGLTLDSSGQINGTPTIAGTYPFTLRLADGGSSVATKTVSIRVSAALAVNACPAATAVQGQSYSASLTATGGSGPYTWSIAAGSLPSGLTLDAKAGTITGSAGQTGASAFAVVVTDANQAAISKACAITVIAPLTITTSALGAASKNAPFTQQLSAVGGTPPYSWSVSAGTLPSGINMSASGSLSGTPVAPGNYAFTARVKDNANLVAEKPLTLAVADALSITACPAASGIVGKAYDSSATATGGQPPYLWNLGSGSVPIGLTLNALNGEVSGTPTSAGTYPFSLVVTDKSGVTATQGCNITIAPTLAVTTQTLPDASLSSAYTQTLLASGGRAPYTWALVSGALPPGMSLSPTGQISGQPAQTGKFSFTVAVTDATQATAQQALSITVFQSLIVAACPTEVAETGFAYNSGLLAEGGTQPFNWTFSSGAAPTGLSLDAKSGVISGKPTQAGTAPFTITVTDAANRTATRNCSINVQPQVGIGTSSLPGGSTGATYTGSVSATGGVPPYAWSTISGSLPPGLTLDPSNGQIVGRPVTAGAFQFTVQATDNAGAQATAALSISIAQGLSIPNCPTPVGAVGQAYSAALVALGGAQPYAWTITSGTLPTGLTLDSGNSLISGTPTDPGAFTYVLQVADKASSNSTRACSLQISSAPLAITSAATLPNATVGVKYTQALSATGGHPPYSWSIQSAGAPDSFALDASGQLTGVPTAAGTYSFMVQVADQDNNVARQSVTLAVLAGAAPSVTVAGLTDIVDPGQQPTFNLQLGGNYPAQIDGTMTLTFTPDPTVGVDDPAILFANGKRTLTFTVPPNSSTPVFTVPEAFQTGTVAGTIQLSVKLMSNGTDITPANNTLRTVRVDRLAPKISSVVVSQSSGGFQVQLSGFSTTREVTQGTFTFTLSNGQAPIQVVVPMSDAGKAWFQSNTSLQYGGQFSITQPFTLQGQLTVSSVSVTLTNAQGTSDAANAKF